MDNWHLGAEFMRVRQRESLREVNQTRLAHLATANGNRGRSGYFSAAEAVEWLQCRLGTWQWRISGWIRAARLSPTRPGQEAVVYERRC